MKNTGGNMQTRVLFICIRIVDKWDSYSRKEGFINNVVKSGNKW